MPVFTACTQDGIEISAVIAPDDDFAREMIRQKLEEEERYITLHYWQESGMRIKLNEKRPRSEKPRSLF